MVMKHSDSNSQEHHRRGPRVTVIGGGTGLSTMLRWLKEYTENITAIVAVSDDGGCSGILRQELGMPPPGDIRNCLVALANVEPIMEKLLSFRFTEGKLAGQCFGNLFLAALDGICDSFDQAVSRMGEVLAITGRVLPVTDADINLKAIFENGSVVLGESQIYARKKAEACRIREICLTPDHPKALPGVLSAIKEAELVVIGPGSLYTSVIPNLLVDGVTEAIAASTALKIFVCNVMTQESETEGYTASDHLKAIINHAGQKLVDICLVNTAPAPAHLIARYNKERAEPLRVDKEGFHDLGVRLAGCSLIGDTTTYARHDPNLLARALLSLLWEERVMDDRYCWDQKSGVDVYVW